jgi:demethylmenaquinone methyltransferase / 2-methoxy-6-polyprenyl-1,4-benzoquinol methylase
MFAKIAGRYDLANACLSCGLDHFWRLYVARLVASWKPSQILDLASGSGVLAEAMMKKLPQASIVATDFCEPMLRQAKKRGLTQLVVADGLALPFKDSSFDIVTIGFGLRNMASYETAIREMYRILKLGGHLIVLDFSLPDPPLKYLYRMYLHWVLPRLAGWITGESEAYRYLGESIEAFPKGTTMLKLLESCGLNAAREKRLTGGIVSCYSATKM